MPLKKTTLPFLLSSIVLLSACASSKPIDPVATLEVPRELLTCRPAPRLPEIRSQRDVAGYVVELWESGEDCRQKLDAVRSYVVI